MTAPDDPRQTPQSRGDAQRSCHGKIRWATEADATAAADRQSTDFRADLESYRCPHCGTWHTGNVPRWLALDREYGVFSRPPAQEPTPP